MRTRLMFFGALTLTAVLTACGGGGSTTAAAGPDSTAPATTAAGGGTNGANNQAQRQAYAQCLQQHGVTAGFGGRQGGGPPSSNTTGTTIDPNVMNAARQACASLRPTGGFGAGGFGGGANNPANQAYFQCLQQHGVTFPSTPPTTAAGSTANTGRGRPGFNPNDPAFQAAQKACASLRPQRGNGTTTTTG